MNIGFECTGLRAIFFTIVRHRVLFSTKWYIDFFIFYWIFSLKKITEISKNIWILQQQNKLKTSWKNIYGILFTVFFLTVFVLRKVLKFNVFWRKSFKIESYDVTKFFLPLLHLNFTTSENLEKNWILQQEKNRKTSWRNIYKILFILIFFNGFYIM